MKPGGSEGTSPRPGVSEQVTDRIVTLPNLLSGLRLASVPVFVWLFVTDRTNLAVSIYALAAWTDFFDGYIARRTGTVSELGRTLDPLADRVFIAALAVALVARDVVPLWLALGILARDAVLGVALPLLGQSLISLKVNFRGKVATAALLFGLTWWAISETDFFLASLGDELGWAFTVAGGIVYWAAGVAYLGDAHRARHRAGG